eukprot:294517-Amphidinium_carterae.1
MGCLKQSGYMPLAGQTKGSSCTRPSQRLCDMTMPSKTAPVAVSAKTHTLSPDQRACQGLSGHGWHAKHN